MDDLARIMGPGILGKTKEQNNTDIPKQKATGKPKAIKSKKIPNKTAVSILLLLRLKKVYNKSYTGE